MDKPTTHKNTCSCGHSVTAGNPKESAGLLNEGNDLPIMLALLPCGLRNAFQQAVFSTFPEYALPESPKVIIEGNLNYEKTLYGTIDGMVSLDELPDILITSDINSLYHKEFLDKYLNPDNFEILPADVNPLFEEAGYVHPEGVMSWFTTNLLVLVVDTCKLGVRQCPESWLDILKESYSNDLTLRGDTDFFCNAMFFPYMKAVGSEAIRRLGKNTAKGLHPSQMVKMLNSGNADGTSIYAMPYSFALKVRNTDRFKIVFPVEGAIVSPVQLLVKKGAYQKYKSLIDFILGEEMADVLVQSGFPSAHPASENKLPANTLNWIGWDFIKENDIRTCKKEMQQLFFSEFNGGMESLLAESGRK
ncbi:MAG: ABC transporter substrate-binding protein [Paludibacter sp.]